MDRAYHARSACKLIHRCVTTRQTDCLTAAPGGHMAVDVRKGQGDVKLSREEFERRLRERFYDPAFDSVKDAVDRVVDVAWRAYDEYRKSPRTRRAGAGFADPDFELPVEWL